MADPAVDGVPVTRRPKKKLIVIGAAVMALVLALGAGTIVVLKQRAAHAAAAADEDAAPPEASTQANAATALKGVPFYLPLDPFIVNLADREADRYAQIGITFEVESSLIGDQIKAYMPAIRNAVLMILANKTSKDLLNREGKEQLALEIQREAVRPMGIEIAGPELVTMAPGGASAAAGAGAADADAVRSKPRRRAETQRNPIQHVHFSSFIIQ
jgi:flagellar FliL protein